MATPFQPLKNPRIRFRLFSPFAAGVLAIIVGFSIGLVAEAAPSVSLFKKSAITVTAQNGTVERRLETEIFRAEKSAPVVVLLNGLIYETKRWNPVADALAGLGLTVVKMSFSAQPESLRLLKNKETPSFLNRGLELSTLADDVKQVLDHHQIRRPITLVGLSYGGAVAAEFAKIYPEKIENLLLLSPLVVPLDTYNPASAPLHAMLGTVRFWEDNSCAMYGWVNPWFCSAKDFWYDSFYSFFYESYLNLRIAETPKGIEPAIYKKAVFQLIRAVRDFNLKTEAAHLKNVHLVIAEGDDVNLKSDQRKTWLLVPENERRSLAEFVGVVHALPDEAPERTTKWIFDVARGESSLQNGTEYIVDGN